MAEENSEEWKKREEERIQKQLQMKKPHITPKKSGEIPAWKKKQQEDEERIKTKELERKAKEDEIRRLKVQDAIKEQEIEASKTALELVSPKKEEHHETAVDESHANPFHLSEEAQQEAENDRQKREEERLSKALEKKRSKPII